MMNPEEFLEVFPPGRTDAFGAHGGRKAITVKKSLDPFVIRQHLAGKTRIGLFPLSHDGRVRWGVIDIDDGGVAPVTEITTMSRKWGLNLAVERSKSKGWHLWVFFSEWTPAGKVRATLQGLLAATGWDARRFEIFPKQDEVGKDGFGNYMFAPCHGGSAKEGRTLFVDTTEEQWPPFPDQVGYLQSLPRYSEQTLDTIIELRGLKVETVRAGAAASGNGDATDFGGGTNLPLPPCAATIYKEGVTSPGRSDWAHFLARHFRRRGLPQEATIRLLLDWNQKNKPEPLPADKIREMAANAYRKEYTSLGCEYLPGAKDICGDQCPVRASEERKGDSYVEQEIETTPFVLLPAREFLGRHYGTGAAVVAEWGWRETGVLVYAAHGGHGKSLSFLQAAVELVQGTPVFGRFKVNRPHRVGLFLIEDAEDETQCRLRRILGGKGLLEPPENLFIFERAPLEFGGYKGRINEEALSRLRATILTHQLTIVMFDPLAYLHAGEENSNSEMLRWLRRLAGVCRDHGTALAMSHHVTWELGGDMHARGASAISNWADVVLKGRRIGDGEPLKVKLECAKVNFAPRFKPVVLEADANLVLTARPEVEAVCPPGELVRFLEEDLGGAFQGNKGDFYAAACRHFGCSDKPVREATATAEKQGWIRTQRGKGIEVVKDRIGNW